MAIGWFTVLKSVPWSTVISNAPVVADGAKKLWSAVANRSAGEAAAGADAAPVAPAQAQGAKPIQEQLADARAESARLEDLMLASSELINALAEQNAQLVERVEALRVRTLLLTRLTAGLAVLAAAGVALSLFGLVAT